MAIQVKDRVVVVKGCKALNINKYEVAVVEAIKEMGADYSHQVFVTLRFIRSNKVVSLAARHINRLSDAEGTNLNNGNPLNKITIQKK